MGDGRAMRQQQCDGKVTYYYMGQYVLESFLPGSKRWVKYRNGDGLDCRRANLRVLDRTRGKQTWREVNRMRKYGLDNSEFEILFEEQEGRCAICRCEFDLSHRNGPRDLAVDHCHARGNVRALLCRNCNLGLGCFADDPTRLRAAASYLDFHIGSYDAAQEERAVRWVENREAP